MKKFILLSLCLALLALCACGTPAEQSTETGTEPSATTETAPDPQPDTGTEKDEHRPDYGPLSFTYKDSTFGIFDEAAPVMAAIGEPMDSFVSESCAFQGNDTFYYYDGIELQVNLVGETERITGITLSDDTVKTPQGLCIGMDIEKALELMNMEYEQNGSVYSFTYGSTVLMLQVGKDNSLTAIQYTSAVK